MISFINVVSLQTLELGGAGGLNEGTEVAEALEDALAELGEVRAGVATLQLRDVRQKERNIEAYFTSAHMVTSDRKSVV